MNVWNIRRDLGFPLASGQNDYLSDRVSAVAIWLKNTDRTSYANNAIM